MTPKAPWISDAADVAPDVTIGANTRVWHAAQIREGVEIGNDCIIGRSAYVGAGVVIGSRCKVQNNALIYEPAIVEEGVFIGPAVVLTNDRYPRATNSDGLSKSATDWEQVGVTVRKGASIGANATCVAPLTVGEWAMVAAGSVVVRDVLPFELVGGNPARHLGWVGHAGTPLLPDSSDATVFRCPRSERTYALTRQGIVPTQGSTS